MNIYKDQYGQHLLVRKLGEKRDGIVTIPTETQMSDLAGAVEIGGPKEVRVFRLPTDYGWIVVFAVRIDPKVSFSNLLSVVLDRHINPDIDRLKAWSRAFSSSGISAAELNDEEQTILCRWSGITLDSPTGDREPNVEHLTALRRCGPRTIFFKGNDSCARWLTARFLGNGEVVLKEIYEAEHVNVKESAPRD